MPLGLLKIVHTEGACMSWLVWVSVTRAVVDSYHGKTKTSEDIDISLAEEAGLLLTTMRRLSLH
jgi:hypothetical protein